MALHPTAFQRNASSGRTSSIQSASSHFSASQAAPDPAESLRRRSQGPEAFQANILATCKIAKLLLSHRVKYVCTCILLLTIGSDITVGRIVRDAHDI